MTNDGPPYRFPRERGDVPTAINLKNATAIRELVDFRDLINAEVFSHAAIMGYESTIRLLIEHWRTHPPSEEWKFEKALELRRPIGRPRRRHREWGEIIAEEERERS